MKKLASIAAGLAVVPVLALATAPVFADSPGQLEGGANIYVVKNLTQKGSYGSTAAIAACGDELQYSIELHNTEFGLLSDINVKATLGSTSNMTATTAAGGTTGTDGTVTVTGLQSNQTLAYESGSTQLFDGSGKLVKTLADGITAGGISVGNLTGSTTEFVNFKAKVSCPTTPPVTPPTTPKTPPVLPNTGTGDTIGVVIGAIVAGTVAGRLFLSRKLARR